MYNLLNLKRVNGTVIGNENKRHGAVVIIEVRAFSP